MNATKWTGKADYDALLDLSEEEMRELADYYNVDWTFFTEAPAKHFEDQYFCFVNYSRKVLALLPALSYAFGGMYSRLPFEGEPQPVEIDFAEYSLEKFKWES